MSQATSQTETRQEQSGPANASRNFSYGTLFLLVVAAVAIYFCYVIARPFLSPMFLALMIAMVFHPIHTKLQRRIPQKNMAAIVSTILVLVAVVVPTAIVGTLVTREAHAVYIGLTERSAEQGGWSPYAMHLIDRLSGWERQYLHISDIDLRAAVGRSLQQISQSLLSWGTHFLSNIVSFFVEAIITFLTVFFLFREGESLKLRLAALLPLTPDQFGRLFSGISDSIVANVYGCIAVAASQGILMSLGFRLVGLPSPILWGLLTAFCSLLPVVGSFVVWGPAAAYLFISGQWAKGLLLLFWSAALVSQIDNLVRPYVVSQRANMHPLLMFVALLGGVQAFGPLGLFLGPVVVSIAIVALNMLHETNSYSAA